MILRQWTSTKASIAVAIVILTAEMPEHLFCSRACSSVFSVTDTTDTIVQA